MRLLLDTHTFLWFIAGDKSLNAKARQIIEDVASERLLSVASAWEIAIKNSIGKPPLRVAFGQFLSQQVQQNTITLLPVEMPHLIQVSTRPCHHRDPFDRMLAAQSLAEWVPLVGVDAVFGGYGVSRLW